MLSCCVALKILDTVRFVLSRCVNLATFLAWAHTSVALHKYHLHKASELHMLVEVYYVEAQAIRWHVGDMIRLRHEIENVE
jgi:hypothetical protein